MHAHASQTHGLSNQLKRLRYSTPSSTSIILQPTTTPTSQFPHFSFSQLLTSNSHCLPVPSSPCLVIRTTHLTVLCLALYLVPVPLSLSAQCVDPKSSISLSTFFPFPVPFTMQAYSHAYIFATNSVSVPTLPNSSSLFTPEHPTFVSLDPDLDLDEAIFLGLSIFLLYCYVGLIRLRIPPSNSLTHTRDPPLTYAARRKPIRSGLTPQQIENSLTSFIVHPTTTASEKQRIWATNTHDYCAISFGQDACAICLETFAGDAASKVRQLPCDHVFHQECIDEWLLRCNRCPCCQEPAC